MLASVASKVVGVEIVEEAVEAAKKNAVDNHLDNCEFIAGDVLKVVDNLAQKPDILVPCFPKHKQITHKASRLTAYIHHLINIKVNNLRQSFWMNPISRRIEYENVRLLGLVIHNFEDIT